MYASALVVAVLALPLASGFAQRDDLELVSLSTVARESTFSTIHDGSYSASLSEDGNYVVFDSGAQNFVDEDLDFTHDVYIRDRAGQTTTLISRPTGAGTKGNGSSSVPTISCDGRYVAFTSAATNLDPADTDVTTDIFLRDRTMGTTELVSRASGVAGASANGNTPLAMISCDGRYVAFSSTATNLSPDDTDSVSDIFVRDVLLDTTTLVSRATTATGVKGNARSLSPTIAPNGPVVTFDSDASNLDPDDTDPTADVYARNLATNTTTLVSRATGASGPKGNGASVSPWITRDGLHIAFMSTSTNLHADDGDASDDVFVRDLDAETTTLASRATGVAGAKGNASSSYPQIALDGRYVAFQSQATNLDGSDPDAIEDIYVRDLESDTTTLASRASGGAGAKGNADSLLPAVSAAGRYVAFESLATNLVGLDQDEISNIFIRDVLGSGDEPPPPPPPPVPPPPVPPPPVPPPPVPPPPVPPPPVPPPPVPPPPPPPPPATTTTGGPGSGTATGTPTSTPPPAPPGPSGAQSTDRDGDGIRDSRDKCPRENSRPRDANRNGCLDYRRVDGRFVLDPDRYLRFPFRDPVRDVLGIKVRSLVGTRLTKGADVELTCSRRACRREHVTVGAGGRIAFKRIAGSKLRTGTRIVIRARLKGAVGLGTTYVVKPNSWSKRRYCIRPGTTREGSCSRVR